MSAQKSKTVEVPAALVTSVGEATSGILSMALTALAGHQLNTLRANVTGYLGKNLSLASYLSSHDIGVVPDQIETELDADYGVIIDALKVGIVEGVGGTLGSLYETLAGVNALTSGYIGMIQRVGIDPYISRWVNTLIRPNIPDAETAWLMHRMANIDDARYKNIGFMNGWDEEWLGQLDTVWQTPLPISVLLDLYRRGLVSLDDLEWQFRLARFDENRIDAIINLATQYPEPYRLAEMYTKGLTTDAEYLGVTRTFGLQDEWSMKWAEGQFRYPDFNTALALLRRGEINELQYYVWMRRGQVDTARAGAMLKLRDVIPPIQDLIRFAVREAYIDHSPEVQYPAMVDMAKKMGLTAESAEWYWYAHWDRIPVNLMFANYHRGLWDATKLERMLKIVDIHPDDRQDIINVAYGPPNVRELGYGWDVGVYTQEDIEKYRRFGGLSPEDAKKAAISLVAYRTEGERNSVRTELMYAYGFERIDEDTLFAELTLLNTPAEAIDLWIERAKLYHERLKKPTMDIEGRIVSSSEALTAFKLKLRNEEWARASLKALDWTQDRIDTAIERAKFEMTETEQKEVEVKYRKLTLAQLRQMYTMKIINKEQMSTEIILIGYTPEDAELLAEIYTQVEVKVTAIKNYNIADANKFFHYQIFDEDDIFENYMLEGYDEPHSEMLTLLTKLNLDYPILASLYEKGYVNTIQFKAELVKLGMSEYDADLLILRTQYEYQVSRLAPEKDLTKAEILKGAKNNVITPTQASSLLQDLGYDENEAYYILAINKVVAAGDPEGYWDMRRVTEGYKKARGEKHVDIPDDLIILERQQKKLKAQLDEARKKPENEQLIADLTLQLGAIETQMKQMIMTRGLS